MNKSSLIVCICLAFFPVFSYAADHAPVICGVDILHTGMWQCDSLQDCVVVDGACGWAAVNKQFVNEGEKYYSCMKSQVECRAPNTQDKRDVKVDCIKNRCVIISTVNP